MIEFINILQIIPILVVIFFIYIIFKCKLWKLLPKEGKIILIMVLAYVTTNQIVAIFVEDINSKIKITVYITFIYLFLIMVIFTRFLKRFDRLNISK